MEMVTMLVCKKFKEEEIDVVEASDSHRVINVIIND